jgi:hypothetical protein
VTPAIVRKIGAWWLEGKLPCQIARRLDLSESTVRNVINSTLKPLWESEVKADKAVILAKVAHMEQVAWERFRSKAPAETREQVKKELLGSRGKDGKSRPLVEQAINTIRRPGQVAWMQVVQWCQDFRAKVLGLYAAQKHDVTLNGFRAAGIDREAIDREMLKKWMDAIEERRRYHRETSGAPSPN